MIPFSSIEHGLKTSVVSPVTFRSVLRPRVRSSMLLSARSTYSCQGATQNSFNAINLTQLHNSVSKNAGSCISKQSQLKFSRGLHTSDSRHVFYEKPPRQKIIRNQNFLQYMWYQIPDWVKLCGGVTIGAYIFVRIAVPLMIVVVPPLLIGGWMYKKLRNYSETKARHEDYTILQHSSLIYTPPKRGSFLIPPPEQINSEIANFEINRIIDAFWSNEGGIADYFKIGKITNIALGSLEAASYDIDDSDSIPVLYASQQRV